MKHYFFAAIAAVASLLAFAPNAQAQSQFNKGDFALNVNYSLGKFSQNDFGWGGSWSTTQHAFGVMGEYGIMNVINSKGTISVGGQVGTGFGSKDGVDCFRFRVATRGTLHYSFIPEVDTYAGMTFCFFDINKAEYDYAEDGKRYTHKDTETKFIEPRLFAGARYMFNSNVGANAEFSWDHYALMSLGITFKF